MTSYWVRVALDVPLEAVFDYRVPEGMPVCRGQRVIVPFGGKQEIIGVIVNVLTQTDIPPEKQKDVINVLDDLPPFSEQWLQFCEFAAQYYMRPIGEVILPVLPPPLRKITAYTGKTKTSPVERLDKKLANQVIRAEKEQKKRLKQQQSSGSETTIEASIKPLQAILLALNDEQQQAVDVISQAKKFTPILLHGVTGSGKTEVYLQAIAHVLAEGKQAIFLVPEINLTPQFERLLIERFVPLYGERAIAIMHSSLSDGERLSSWLHMQRQEVKVILGTRMSIFAPLENLGLIIVDEEHDASYKQQDGLRYSARDLAVWRAHQLNIPIVLGSATPSLETWHHTLSGKYQKLSLTQRAKETPLPCIKLVNTKKMRLNQGLSADLISAIDERLQRGEQSMIYLNRRGFAPVLRCSSCGWTSECMRCSVHTVLHQVPGQVPILQCHHCGYSTQVPTHCPECGNVDLSALGYGTQRLEDTLMRLFPEARVKRIDADSTRLKGSAQELFQQVHSGDVDIIVGTQMLSKGHDFKRLSLVGVLNADMMLFSGDFRAPERLFAQLMQVAGRAGRHIRDSDVLLQTEYPDHHLYQALISHDYDSFANQTLMERKMAHLPPFAHQVLITAQAKDVEQALAFLQSIIQYAKQYLEERLKGVEIYDPVPLKIVRIAHIERAQLLIESVSRPALHRFMNVWLHHIYHELRTHKVKYFVEVDPLSI
ncbi:primosome assembly protein PriA [Pelistega indica]|uniref:Replication restart protein PriA n=1 Tax=Pelistega indica TaxID=1414851 RepID=V8G7W2_9BURK|nr:primosomal protein N' [Pelistega indica]ETD72624.1 primosome assembly protein PriA [Pelistega indica]